IENRASAPASSFGNLFRGGLHSGGRTVRPTPRDPALIHCCPARAAAIPRHGISDLTCITLEEVSMQTRVSIKKVTSRRNGKQAVWVALGRTALALLAAGAFTVAGLAEASEADESNGNEHWVGTWSNALHQPDLGVPGLANPGFNNQTLR